MVCNSSRRVGDGFPVPILHQKREAKRLPYGHIGTLFGFAQPYFSSGMVPRGRLRASPTVGTEHGSIPPTARLEFAGHMSRPISICYEKQILHSFLIFLEEIHLAKWEILVYNPGRTIKTTCESGTAGRMGAA